MMFQVNPRVPRLRVIPTRVHGLFDYILALTLLFSPLYFGAGSPASVAAIGLGLSLAVYSSLTDYELGLLRVIPMVSHLVLDTIGGVLLAGFALLGGWPLNETVSFGVIGLVEIVVSLTTSADGLRKSDGRPGPPGDEPQNKEQLRRMIDSGTMGDKIPMSDPAAAPLGSDDEAADLHDEEGLAVARKQTETRH
jgi:hypothetical protein